jgi:hypothetical protein
MQQRAVHSIGMGSIVLMSTMSLSMVIPAYADVSGSLAFSVADISFSAERGYDLIEYPGCSMTLEVGAPAMPVRWVLLAIPSCERVVDVELRQVVTEELPGSYRVLPAQPPTPISGTPRLAEPDPERYQSSQLYPDTWVSMGSEGSMGGYRLVCIGVYPLRYRASDGTLIVAREVDFVVRTVPAQHPTRRSTSWGSSCYLHLLERVVDNSQVLPGFAPPAPVASEDEGGIEYLVVTSEDLAEDFQPLIEWKRQKGLWAEIRSTEWITANYGSGADLQECIRNYLSVLQSDSGLVYVLLGGDVNVVPVRMAFEEESDQEIPTDLYYSDLDGSWDANGNGVYGEVDDSLDLVPDVFVGRAPVADGVETVTFVDKVLSYETARANGYQVTYLAVAESLDASTSGGEALDLVEESCVPSRFKPVTELYADWGNLNLPSALYGLETGFSLINHIGHGSPDYLGVGNGYHSGSDCLRGHHMSGLRNGDQLSFLHTVGCYVADLTVDDAIIEDFVLSQRGGGFAIANSRYGWYQHGHAENLSGEFDLALFHALLQEEIQQAGIALAACKLPFLGAASDSGVYRYIYFQLNLFGDPETTIWTDIPGVLAVDHPDHLPTGEATPCTVGVYAGSEPEEGVAISFYKADEVWVTGTTDAEGRVVLEVLPETPGQVSLVAHRPNARPYRASLPVQAGVPYPCFHSYIIDDGSTSHSDGRAEPGQSGSILVRLVNRGSGSAVGVRADLAVLDPAELDLLTASSPYPDIREGEEAVCDSAFDFAIDPGCPEGTIAHLLLTVTAGSDFSLSDTLEMLIKSRDVLLVDDDGGGRVENRYLSAMESLGRVHDLVAPDELAPSALMPYRSVIWFTGSDTLGTLSSSDQDLLRTYLENGGNLVLTGFSIGAEIGEGGFYQDWLHASYNGVVEQMWIDGVVGDPVSGGLVIELDDTLEVEVITPCNGGTTMLTHRDGGTSGAVRYESQYRVVAFGFGLESIVDGGDGADMATVLGRVLSWISGVEEGSLVPENRPRVAFLAQNAPNPFCEKSTISYQVPAKQSVRISIFNLAGQRVRVLADGIQEPGYHQVKWDGTGERGDRLGAGVYFCHLSTDGYEATRKMILMR